MGKGIYPEDGRPGSKTRRQTVDRGQLHARLLPLEGGQPPLGVVILEFPSLEQAQEWHDDPDYGALKQLRQANVDMEVFVVERV
jgi:uncharacterized protein (DUF1330 family)